MKRHQASRGPAALGIRQAARLPRLSHLKAGAIGVDTPSMKVCPHCEAELRDSVIRCTRCGRSLREAPDEPGATLAPAGLRAHTAGSPAPGAPNPAPRASGTGSGAWAPSAAPKGAGSVAAPARPKGPAVHLATNLAERRALPTGARRSNRPDVPLLAAGLVTAFAAYTAWSTLSARWVEISISAVSDDGTRPLGSATLRAMDGTVGTVARFLVVTLAAMAVLWLFFGLQRGWTMPWFSTPIIGMIGAAAALGGTVLSGVLWFMWRDAIMADAAAYGQTSGSLDQILNNADNSPAVSVQRLAGTMRFGTMMLVALAASCLAWWAYHKRSS